MYLFIINERPIAPEIRGILINSFKCFKSLEGGEKRRTEENIKRIKLCYAHVLTSHIDCNLMYLKHEQIKMKVKKTQENKDVGFTFLT